MQTRRKSDASATSETKAAAIKYALSARKRKSDAAPAASDVVSDSNRVTTQSLMSSGSIHNEPRFKFPDLCISSTREISNASSSNAAAAATSSNHYDHSSDASCVDLSDDDILDMYMKS
eukprot:370011_1